jgi:hypothetical protein
MMHPIALTAQLQFDSLHKALQGFGQSHMMDGNGEVFVFVNRASVLVFWLANHASKRIGFS